MITGGGEEWQKFQMCRDCRNEEKYCKTDKDTVQIVRPNQFDAVVARCLKCRLGMDSCGCKYTRSGTAEPGQPGTQKSPFKQFVFCLYGNNMPDLQTAT